MLNDLFSVERGMAAHGIGLVGRHPDIKDMAKGGALRVRLAADGDIVVVEIVEEGGRGALWTLRDGQHNGFPGLKTAAGLLALEKLTREAHDRAWDSDKKPTSRRSELLRLLSSYSIDAKQLVDWPNTGHRKRIKERLEALRSLAKNMDTASVPAAFERFLLALERSPSFLEQLAHMLADRIRNSGDEWLEPARRALTGPAALAIDGDTDFPWNAGDPRQIEAVSLALSAVNADEPESKAATLCALSGKAAKLHTRNFPQPNLPGLGQTYIFSRNRDIPSLTRYRRTADASFSVDADLLRRMSGAITRLTREEAKDRTWRLIPAEKGDKPDLLITSIVSLPDAGIAEAVAGDEGSEDQAGSESVWSELGARVTEQSRGILSHEYPQDEVLVLILRTVDPANRKVIYHRNTSALELFNAAKLWGEAASNIPNWLGFRSPVRGQSELVFRKPPRLKPLSITPLSRVKFANGGHRRVDVIGVTSAEAFGLFLREGSVEQHARKVLRLLIQRHSALLSGLAAARTKGIDDVKDFDPKTDLRRDALKSAAWFGVLLQRLGRAKEAYMSDAAFRLGQFLAVADVVHIGYCNDLRSGDVPPTLIGNSVLAVAGADPVRALSVLQTRLKPYLAWAKRADPIFAKAANEERQGNKGRAIALRQGVSQARRANDIATDLHTMLAPYRGKSRSPDDAFRAELLLGYVAGLPPAKRGDGDPMTETNEALHQNEGSEL
jgi:hypothetical protein